MNLLTQLELKMHFTESENILAQYILEHGEEVVKMSIHTFAKKTYSSPATIVRLAKKCGLSGFNDLKINLAKELSLHTSKEIDPNFPFDKDDDFNTIINNLTLLHKETIDDSAALLDQKTLSQCVKLLDKADSIDLYGLGNSLLVAQSFAHNMMRIGKQVNFRTMAGEQGFLARVSNPKHVAIIISYSGETDEIIRIAKTLKKQKTKIIAITSLGDNQLSHYSDLILHISSKEKIFNKMAPFSSLLSIQYICTMLYACFFSLNYNEHKAFKLHYDYEEDLRHPFYSPINEK